MSNSKRLDVYLWLGLGGVAPSDTPQALAWERRLHWPMLCVALLTVPAFFLEGFSANAFWQGVGEGLSAIIFVCFSAELLLMLSVTRQPLHYVLRNGLNVVIVVLSGVALTHSGAEMFPLLRLLRLVYIGLALLRALRALRRTLSPGAAPYILSLAVVMLLVAGAGFYWLEPTVHSYGEGIWLAFTSGATVGYGDLVPTTTASRFFAVLMVLLGYTLMSLATASIAAFFIGEDERALRREMHHDIKQLQHEVALLRADLARAAAEREPAVVESQRDSTRAID